MKMSKAFSQVIRRSMMTASRTHPGKSHRANSRQIPSDTIPTTTIEAIRTLQVGVVEMVPICATQKRQQTCMISPNCSCNNNDHYKKCKNR